MPELQQKPQKRQIAHKVRIKDIIDGEYIREGGWSPNYIQISGEKQVSRVNLIGTVVQKQNNDNYTNLILDDGSGKISLRSFDENLFMDSVNIGDVVMLIGRPREFGTEKYVVVEILKKIENPVWLKVRKLELDGSYSSTKSKTGEVKVETEENGVFEDVEEISEGNSDKICNLIKELDSGSGISIEDINERLKIDDIEKIINNLLKEGEIFEVNPGKLKVLE